MGNVAIAVTRNGLGDFYSFQTRSAADLHPIVQYGDVICDGPESVARQYNQLEMPDLLRRLGNEGFRGEVLAAISSSLGWVGAMQRYSPGIWDAMVRIASRPPTDPAEVVSVVVRDRKLSIIESMSRERGEKKMTAEDQVKEPKAAKEPKAPKERAEPTTMGGYKLTDTITLLADKEGKPYGADNNPKKAGSQTHARFAKYVTGQTVKDAYDAGVAAGDFAYDVSKNFISIG